MLFLSMCCVCKAKECHLGVVHSFAYCELCIDSGIQVCNLCQVHIQKSIDKIPHDSALYFEFKRWKAQKGLIASKAYSFIDWDQLSNMEPGKCALEVYKAPADFSRKTKTSLLSVKPLYLHLIAYTQVA